MSLSAFLAAASPHEGELDIIVEDNADTDADWIDIEVDNFSSSPLSSPISPLPPSSDPGYLSSSPTPLSPLYRRAHQHAELITPERIINHDHDAATPMTPIAQLFTEEFSENLPSSAVKGTKSEKTAQRKRKGHQRQAATIAKKKKETAELTEQAKDEACDEVLSFLASKNLRVLDLLNYVSNPEKGKGVVRWQQLFVHHGAIAQILDWWVSPKNSAPAREQISSWAAEHVASRVKKEAEYITRTGALQTLKRAINRKLVSAFNLSEYTTYLHNNWAPIMMKIISAFATSPYAPGHKSQRREKTRHVMTIGKYAVVYDNINMGHLNAEQILGRHDSQENGTCATLFTLSGPVKDEDLDITQFQEAFLNAPPLSIDDITLSPSESIEFKENLLATVLRIIVEHGGEAFHKFRSNMANFQPKSALKPTKPTRTEIFPLTSWEIDESSILGNIEVVNTITKELHLLENEGFLNRVRFMSGDQLSMSRLRSIETIRAGHEKKPEDYFWGVNIPGLFHTKIADTHGILLTHFGKPNAGTSNPGSLSFHNTRLDRLPITLTSPPPFRVCRDLIFVSLYARILHCLLLVSNTTSLENYLKTHGSWELLVLHAREILDRFTKGETVDDLRWKRELSKMDDQGGKSKDPVEGDMVFENAILFLRDALISREFSDAIKANDPGCIILVLKTFALSFRGNGRLKYAYEMLHFIHNIKHVWPASIRRIVLNNLVLNPSGLPESGVEVDLMQEHMNLLGKVRFKARGSNVSWDWMSMMMPCTEALRELQVKMHRNLGNDIGSKHADARLAEDIQSLMDSLSEHKVYTLQPGRVTDNDDPPVPDVISTGLHHISNPAKSPLNDYNSAFRKLQKHRRMTPVSTAATSGIDPAQATSREFTLSTDLPRPSASHSDITANVNSIVPEHRADAHLTEELGENELWHILMDLQGEEDTLPRVSLQDVALDMDILEDEDSGSDGGFISEDDE